MSKKSSFHQGYFQDGTCLYRSKDLY